MNDAARDAAGTLEAWMDEPVTRASLKRARAAFDELASTLAVRPALREELGPALLNVFLRTGYLKDYKLLRKYARRVNQLELLEEVDEVVRAELPDVWILAALRRGDVDGAIECWFEHEEHDRARLCAGALVDATPRRTDILVSGRLSVVGYYIGRAGRSRYRRACRVLKTLRSELDEAGEMSTWPLVLEDVLARHGHRPALLDEMKKAEIL